ncbi:MAG: calcium-binding protein [Hyphomicrobiaceae bacterium]|nr:calcium-binding protein [Hyphomicrobiaceae bacterium]
MANFNGTRVRDVFNGTRDRDTINGFGGDDLLRGGLGDDLIRGGDGNDLIYGGVGNDRVFGDRGNDRIYGDAGDDLLYGGDGNDLMYGGGNNDRMFGDAGNDRMFGDAGDDIMFGGSGVDMVNGGTGNDRLYGGLGNDTIMGGTGNDTAYLNVSTEGADTINLGGETGDAVIVNASSTTNVRLSFTSAEVGNGNGNDSNTMMNQDGGLAVRLQAEDGMGVPMGPTSRIDDEGTTFVGGAGVTFDVRDLVNGAQRGELFEVVVLGTSGADTLSAVQAARPYYFNGGMGDDTITDGNGNDFLVGGAGADTLTASVGNDTFIGGGGNDTIVGGVGTDTIAAFNITTDGADSVDLGLEAAEVFNVSATAATNVRLTFTSAEIGNGSGTDSNSMMNQDGGLAIRMQAEDALGMLPMGGNVTRVDDEGVVFIGGTGVTFDVRDLVSGAQRGELFEIVSLGT